MYAFRFSCRSPWYDRGHGRHALIDRRTPPPYRPGWSGHRLRFARFVDAPGVASAACRSSSPILRARRAVTGQHARGPSPPPDAAEHRTDDDSAHTTRRTGMKIGIMGAGSIGSVLADRLSAHGHQVKIANSRGPETISAEVLASGAEAVRADQVAAGVDVLITSVPLVRVPDLKPLLGQLPGEAVVIDTSNYYPARDGHIEALDGGLVESRWVEEQLGRSIVKAWNAITAQSFGAYAAPSGASGRIAVPVAADHDDDRGLGMSLVEQTGFQGFDAGTITDSWRQQPGTPVYCTDLTADEMPRALESAIAARSPRRRDLAMNVISELMGDPTSELGEDFLVRVNRLLYV
nr:NAD(P)-binding domain-containing protein [Nakamurella deserti]